MENTKVVCVTGGSGYLASHLIRELLQRGHTVHATERNLGDESKVGLLKGLPYADTRLKLFQADVYKADEFANAIHGCEVVIHMATPLEHSEGISQFKNTSEAAVTGVRRILASCKQTKTVKRLIYTASVLAASPLKDDGSGYKDSVDETCWTPLNISIPHGTEIVMGYTHSKTLSEKEVLSGQGCHDVEIVTLALGLVGGDTVQNSIHGSLAALVSQIKGDHAAYNSMRFIEEALGKVPVMHIEDVTAAHIFFTEDTAPGGRYLCANGFLSSAEIAAHYQTQHPDIKIAQEFVEDIKREIRWGSTKLEDLGFCYKCDHKKTLDGSLQCAKRVGYLQ